VREFEEIVKLQEEAARFYERAGNAVGPTARVAARRLAAAARLDAEARISDESPEKEERSDQRRR
jgi:hypothetical protein